MTVLRFSTFIGVCTANSVLSEETGGLVVFHHWVQINGFGKREEKSDKCFDDVSEMF